MKISKLAFSPCLGGPSLVTADLFDHDPGEYEMRTPSIGSTPKFGRSPSSSDDPSSPVPSVVESVPSRCRPSWHKLKSVSTSSPSVGADVKNIDFSKFNTTANEIAAAMGDEAFLQAFDSMKLDDKCYPSQDAVIGPPSAPVFASCRCNSQECRAFHPDLPGPW